MFVCVGLIHTAQFAIDERLALIEAEYTRTVINEIDETFYVCNTLCISSAALLCSAQFEYSRTLELKSNLQWIHLW